MVTLFSILKYLYAFQDILSKALFLKQMFAKSALKWKANLYFGHIPQKTVYNKLKCSQWSQCFIKYTFNSIIERNLKISFWTTDNYNFISTIDIEFCQHKVIRICYKIILMCRRWPQECATAWLVARLQAPISFQRR